MTRDYIRVGIAGSRELERCSVTPNSAEVKLLHKWFPPNLGDLPVWSVNNLAVRALVNKITEGGMSAKTANNVVHNVVQVVKMVMASTVNVNVYCLTG